ncbi:phosphomannomutase/phosphoglucomutase [Nitrospina watsonii]|uniref:Phosphomannomutase/phosphoglucomutase n=1 Tax=Nitrospina watsonii TaxID=1323948 RepID=A0ABN8W1Z9_9BACT|nr:phosphomannomutase/phosphoglucomutase [Nitrospina watsonii]CAI2717226.1 phosphomannomutase/phosphoglucomutase [Nitrospina watsonii]
MNPQIFREYDIRGLVEQDLSPENVEQIGKAIGTYFRRHGKKTLTLGWDIRDSSKTFREILTRALNGTGCDVIDIGMVPTPVAYYSLHHLEVDGGVMITGSHNPPEFNGFKISFETHSLYGKRIQELKTLIDHSDFETGNGTAREQDIKPGYMDHIAGIINISRPLKVVLDGGNGCFGIIGPEFFRRLGVEVIEQYCEPDGTFPNHHPDPTVPRYMADLMTRVKRERADLGIGFDGDADRIGVVDDQGTLLWGDQLLILYARELLQRHPGTAVVGEVKCSRNLFEDIKKHGGQPHMSAAGHSLIKKKMQETQALLAGEMSGHMCFADSYYGFDDAIYAACRILEIVANTGQPVSEMLADLPVMHNTPEIRIDCPDHLKFRVVKEVTETFRAKYDVVDIDGVRVEFEDGWGLLRASNTQPVLVLRFEATSKAKLNAYQELMREQLEPYKPDVNFSPVSA